MLICIRSVAFSACDAQAEISVFDCMPEENTARLLKNCITSRQSVDRDEVVENW